jgi:hypothetical protein
MEFLSHRWKPTVEEGFPMTKKSWTGLRQIAQIHFIQ